MGTGTFLQPNYETSSSGTVYKSAIDNSIKVFARFAGAFAVVMPGAFPAPDWLLPWMMFPVTVMYWGAPTNVIPASRQLKICELLIVTLLMVEPAPSLMPMPYCVDPTPPDPVP